MLRRLKENVLRDLPPKTIAVEKCALQPDQKVKYENILLEFKEVSEAKDSNCHMAYFMMLRKMANHPLLLRYYFTVCIFMIDSFVSLSCRRKIIYFFRKTN